MKNESIGGLTDPALWARIRAAKLPDTRDGRDFAQVVARITYMPQAEGREIEAEYRRFLYLSALGDAVRVPPPTVRKAWQLHALSPDYDSFCTEVLGKPLPLDDAARRLGATGAYARTRADYGREFSERPPRMVWPQAIKPRMPRWLWTHAAIWAVAVYLAFERGEPLLLALGLTLTLGLYGFDLWTSISGRRKGNLGDTVSDDLNFFLKTSGG